MSVSFVAFNSVPSGQVYDYNGAFGSHAELMRVDGGKQLLQSSEFCPWQFEEENN